VGGTDSASGGAGTGQANVLATEVTQSGVYTISFAVLNGRDEQFPSAFEITNTQVNYADAVESSSVDLRIGAYSGDTDGSEVITVAITIVPQPVTGTPPIPAATLSAGTYNSVTDTWNLTQADLEGLQLNPGTGYVGTFDLTVVVTATDDVDTKTTQQTLTVVINETSNDLFGDNNGNTLTGDGTDQYIIAADGNDLVTGAGGNDLIQGGAGVDDLDGGAGDDVLYGGTDGDELKGGDGQDNLYGGAGIDTLDGGANDDVLIGGKGADALTGGTGSDVFAWEFADEGTVGVPVVDTITDFSNGANILDLSDLLSGEQTDTLDQYLHFEYDGANTTVFIDVDGVDSLGDDVKDSDSQQIILVGVDLTNSGDLTTDADIINSLLTNNQLIVD
jgi:Ca2+-binding RTX toxin-like protein